MRPVWLTDEQMQLRDMLHRLVADGPVTRTQLAELGVFGATLPEAYGGLGFGLAEAAIIAEALGRARSTIPFAETTILAGGLIAALGSDRQKNDLLPHIADGSLTIALAFAEGLRNDPLAPSTIAETAGGGFTLTGTKAPVARAAEADLLLIGARHGDGLSLHLVARGRLSLSAPYALVDGTAAATIDFNGFEVGGETLLGPAGQAGAALDQTLHAALVVQAAEQTGLMAHLINATIDYLQQRRQFGVPLASFQILQHRVADMLLAYEKAVSLVTKATLADAQGGWGAKQRGIALSAAVMAMRSAQAVGHEAIQLHGGMGVTEELSIGPAVKRIYALETRFAAIDPMAARHAASAFGR